jgi:hypothetical protein
VQPLDAARGFLTTARASPATPFSLVALVDGIRRAGTTTLQSIADALNARGIPTGRGGQWYPTTVKNAVGVLIVRYPDQRDDLGIEGAPP